MGRITANAAQTVVILLILRHGRLLIGGYKTDTHRRFYQISR